MPLKRHLCAALAAFYTHLDGVTLTDLVDGNAGMTRLLTLPLAAE